VGKILALPYYSHRGLRASMPWGTEAGAQCLRLSERFFIVMGPLKALTLGILAHVRHVRHGQSSTDSVAVCMFSVTTLWLDVACRTLNQCN